MGEGDPLPEGDQPVTQRPRLWRAAGIGSGVAAVLAAMSGVAGADGRTGLAVFLLVTSLACAGAALYGVVTLIRDEALHRSVPRTRAVSVGGLFFLAAALMAMLAGIGG